MKKLVLFVLFLGMSFSIAFAATDVAIVNSVVGKVEIQVNDSWLQVKNGDILQSGSVISTGFKSSAVLYIGDSLIEVRALTRLTIEEIVEQNQNYNTTMFLDAGRIKADIKKSENKRVGFTVRTSVATASVRGTSGEIYSDGKLVCLSGKWAVTPPEPKGSKTRTQIEFANIENSDSQPEVSADQKFYDSMEEGAFIVSENQTITITQHGEIIPPHEVAHIQSTNVGGIQSTTILENNSDLRITSPTQISETSVNNDKGKNIATIDVTISVE